MVMERIFEQKIEEAKGAMTKEIENAQKKAVRDAQRVDSKEFKKKGHKEQHKFCMKMVDAFEDAQRALENRDLYHLEMVIKEGKELAESRAQVVEIVDANNWIVAGFFEKDAITRTETEEKRLRKAIKMGRDEMTVRDNARKRRFPFFRGSRGNSFGRFSRGPRGRPDRRFDNDPGTGAGTGRAGPKATDKCFACDQAGHWRGDQRCPKR